MSVKWVKDVDSGELFPIVDEEDDFDIPEHLKVCEHTVVDYEETTKNTITDFQEQLTAAQEQIDVYKNVQAVELQEIVDVQGTLTEKPKHFAIDKSWILLIVLIFVVTFTFFFRFKYFVDNGYFTSVISSVQSVSQQEAVETDEETEESEENDFLNVFNIFTPFIGIGLSYLGVCILLLKLFVVLKKL